ncbi:GPI mannosyltransferase 2 isoform X2 [Hyla sarda]|uniref:GPI mannosyltransferase 2 isoform X2 n=1 Tax=Hyla sarda TaxID=327740 RepID=UPI0024C3BCFA|nr:GPI mannosyltransferase 2 isoform X2 [Hyla sarda]
MNGGPVMGWYWSNCKTWWSQDPFLQEVVRFSLWCRGLTLLMQVVFNLLIPDHSADAFSPPRLEPSMFGDHVVELFFGGLGRWDAEHFLFIAEHGYVYEHNMAFFPLLPLIIGGLARGPLLPLAGLLRLRSRLLISSACLNCVCSTLAAVSLYLLGCVTLQSRRLAFIAALLFCMCPVSIFMSTTYSESLYALATFTGLWQLQKNRTLCGSAFFSFASFARSNGLVNAGFLLYSAVKATVQRKGNCRLVTRTVFGIFFVILPIVLFQGYCYMRSCLESFENDQIPQELLQLALEKGYRVQKESIPAWCSFSIPIAYSHIQNEYWDVGLFRYFKLQQLPNFLLALPVLILSTSAILEYTSSNLELCRTLGLCKVKSKQANGFYGPQVFVHVAHLAALTAFGFLCMHVQVLTRLLFSSCPVLFWFCSHVVHKNEPWIWSLKKCKTIYNPVIQFLIGWTSLQPGTKIILGYFLGYWVIGTALHVNFLPWT